VNSFGFLDYSIQMCGSLSEEGAALKVLISKLQSQLSDALSEANGLRANAKSLEAKVFELMSETQMYRGQIDELQVILAHMWKLLARLFETLTQRSRCFCVRKTSSAVWVLRLKRRLIAL
jgi:hypothetical protein